MYRTSSRLQNDLHVFVIRFLSRYLAVLEYSKTGVLYVKTTLHLSTPCGAPHDKFLIYCILNHLSSNSYRDLYCFPVKPMLNHLQHEEALWDTIRKAGRHCAWSIYTQSLQEVANKAHSCTLSRMYFFVLKGLYQNNF